MENMLIPSFKLYRRYNWGAYQLSYNFCAWLIITNNCWSLDRNSKIASNVYRHNLFNWFCSSLLTILNFNWQFLQGSRRCPCIVCRVSPLPKSSYFHDFPTSLSSGCFWHYMDTYSRNPVPSALLHSNCHQAVCSPQILSPASLMGVGCCWVWRNCRSPSPRT